MVAVPSENILELRKLSVKLCENNSDKYKEIILDVQKVVESGKVEIAQEKISKQKIKCYENILNTITKLLQKLK